MLPDLLISSPAKRAIQTARVFANAIKYPKGKILLNKTLYEANNASSNEALLDEVRSMDDQFQSVIVFGHDPASNRVCPLLADLGAIQGKHISQHPYKVC